MAAAAFAMAALAVLMIQPGPVKADIAAPGQILVSPVLGYHVATLMLGYSAIAMSLIVSLAYLIYTGRQFLAKPGRFRRLKNLLPIPPRPPEAAMPAAQVAEASVENMPEAQIPAVAQEYEQAAVAEQHAQAPSPDWPERLDQANLALIRIATFLVAVGVVLGAYWADLSWGRWWGWDSKETWALMTLLVYVAIIHLRQVSAPSARALWTAALSVVGCLAMLFTWWGVNYLMGGLHSYA
jgi:ABC-type transport system involved in cytochrome c biogenesis permease subunit